MRLRRTLLAGLAAFATVASTPAAARMLDMTNPDDALEISKRAQCGPADGQPAFYHWSGHLYSRVQGEPDRLLFKVVVDRVPVLVGRQGSAQARELLVGLEAAETLGGLEHGSGGPAQRHGRVLPAFDVAADPADGSVHVLDDVGAGE